MTKTIWVVERDSLTRAVIEERGKKTYRVLSYNYVFGFAYVGKTIAKDDPRICDNANIAIARLSELAEQHTQFCREKLAEAVESEKTIKDIYRETENGKDVEKYINEMMERK